MTKFEKYISVPIGLVIGAIGLFFNDVASVLFGIFFGLLAGCIVGLALSGMGLGRIRQILRPIFWVLIITGIASSSSIGSLFAASFIVALAFGVWVVYDAAKK